MAYPPDARWVAQALDHPRLADPRNITDLFNYQLFLIVGMGSAPIVRICETQFGITRHEWGYVGLLAAFGPLAPSDLALHSGMDRSRTSKALMPLVAKGLVERRGVAGDRRRATVALTHEGHKLYQRMFAYATQVHRQLLEGFTPRELATLGKMLVRVRTRALALDPR